MLKSLVSPLAVGVMSRATSQIISFALVVIASRYLDLTGFGTFSLAWAATVICVSFLFTGFYQAILRSTDLERDADTLFWLMFALGALGSGVLAVLGWAVLAGDLGRAFLWMSVIPVAVVMVAWNEALLLAAKRARAASIHHAISELVGICVVIYALSNGAGIMGLVAGRLAAAATGIVMTTVMVRRLPRLRFATAGIRRAVDTAIPLWSTAAVSLFGNYGSDFILGAFLSPAAVGAYRGGSRIAATASDIAAQPLSMLNWAKFTRLEREGRIDDLRAAWYQHAAFSIALTWPMLASVAILAPELTLVLFGEDWMPAAPIITLLAVAKALSVFLQLMPPTLTCMDRGKLQIQLRLAGAALLLILLLITGPYGPSAVAAAHIVTNVIIGGACIWAMALSLDLKYREMLMAARPGLVLTACCCIAIFLTRGEFGQFGAEAALAGLIGLLALIWLASAGWLVKTRRLILPTP